MDDQRSLWPLAFCWLWRNKDQVGWLGIVEASLYGLFNDLEGEHTLSLRGMFPLG